MKLVPNIQISKVELHSPQKALANKVELEKHIINESSVESVSRKYLENDKVVLTKEAEILSANDENKESNEVKETGKEQGKLQGASLSGDDDPKSEMQALEEKIRELEKKILELSTQISLLEAKRELEVDGNENGNGNSEVDKEINSLKVELAMAEGALKATMEQLLEMNSVDLVL